jgi:hypothetical protein
MQLVNRCEPQRDVFQDDLVRMDKDDLVVIASFHGPKDVANSRIRDHTGSPLSSD